MTERYLTTESELRTEDTPEGPKILGYAAIFNSMSLDLGGFREIIRPGAFTKTLASKPDVRALFNHDRNFVLGRTTSKTLMLREDDRGLFYEVEPPDTSWARDLVTSIKRGDVTQSSFAFKAIRDQWSGSGDDQLRELIEVSLGDVSPVTYPAYPATETQVRHACQKLGLDPEIVERALVDVVIRDIRIDEAASTQLRQLCQHVLEAFDSREPLQEGHSTDIVAPINIPLLRKKLALSARGIKRT